MSLHKKLPNSLRNVRAKLRLLSRPIVWGPAGVLLLLVLFMAEYLANPERLTTIIQQPASTETQKAAGTPELSPEESAIAAEMDSLPVLLEDLKRGQQGTSKQNAQPDNLYEQSLNLLQTKSQPSAAAKAPATNPSVNLSELDKQESLNLGSQFQSNTPADVQAGLPSMDSVYQPRLNQNLQGNSLLTGSQSNLNTTPASPLQSALDRFKMTPNPSGMPATPDPAAQVPQTTPTPGFSGVAEQFYSPGMRPVPNADEFNPPYRGTSRVGSLSGGDGFPELGASLMPKANPSGADYLNSAIGVPSSAFTGQTINYGGSGVPSGTGSNTAGNSYLYLTGGSSGSATPVLPSAGNSYLSPELRPITGSNLGQPTNPNANLNNALNNYLLQPGQPVNNGLGQSYLNNPAPTQPATTNSYGQSSVNTTSPLPSLPATSSYGQPTTPVYPTPLNTPLQTTPQPTSTFPRSIGGGEINTFADPTK